MFVMMERAGGEVVMAMSVPTIRYLRRKGVSMMFSLVVVGASPIGGIGYPNGKGL